MHDLGDDNELDHISREAAGRYFTPGTANWQKMEAELDKVIPVEKKRRFPLFWLLPVLLAGGAGYWLIVPTNDAVVAETKPANKVAVSTPPVNKQVESPKNTSVDLTENKVSSVSKADMVATKQPISINRRSSHNSHQAPRQESFQITPEKPITHGATKATQVVTASSQQPQVTGNNDAVKATTPPATENNTQPENTRTASTTAITVQISPENPSPDQPSENPAVAVTTKKIGLPSFGKGWSMAAIAGFDISTVKFNYGNEPGFNIGLVGGYHFNNRWSIHTGAIFTQKNYKMAGADFNAPKGSWASYYNLVNVEGYCRMWEIPLLARYSFGQGGKNNYFISTGLSSYFMSSENYNYFYYQQGRPLTRHTAFGSGDSHILSIAHFSAGFESRLNKNLVLQVEPYAKLPLKGVGFGSIQLSSFGVNFGLQLRQPSKH